MGINMERTRLPIKNQSGYYEMRLESIGGMGANLCGKMLGELGISELGFNCASFSSYGSEKTGTPVKAFIRYSDGEKEIRVHSPVIKPHLLCIFHEGLLRDRSLLDECTVETTLIINTDKTPQQVANDYELCFDDKTTDNNRKIRIKRLVCVNGQEIVMESHSRINVVMLGSICAAMGFVPLEAASRICENTLGKKYPDALPSNLEGIRRGYQELKDLDTEYNTQEKICDKDGFNKEGSDKKNSNEEKLNKEKLSKEGSNILDMQPSWGYKTAPIGGINPNIGSTVVADLSPSRQGYIPLFIQERCINCCLCDTTCPDMVFQFKKGQYKGKEMMVNKGLDYYHCKGCMRCVEVCPTNALVAAKEAEHPNKEWFLPNQDLLRKPDYYEESGPDGYITSESYLTEERIGKGEV